MLVTAPQDNEGKPEWSQGVRNNCTEVILVLQIPSVVAVAPWSWFLGEAN